MFAAALLLLAHALPAAAAPLRVSSGTARFELIEYPGVHASMTVGNALMRLIKESSGTLVSEQTLPCYYSDGDYRFRIPNEEAEFSTSSAILLDSEGEAALIYPPIPEFADKLKALAEDPATYGEHWSLRLSSTSAALTEFETAAGETILTAQLHPEEGEAAQWHTTVVSLSRVTWKGRQVSVLVIGKVFGGLGRLATVIKEARARGEFIGVARDGAFGDELTQPSGPALADALAGLGLKVAGIGGQELRRWPELSAYRKSHPGGIQFISDNLVYSSAPATTLLPDHALIENGGLTVAVLAVTNPYEAKYLKQGGLKGATISDPLQSVASRVAKLREQADVVVLLADLQGPAENRLRLWQSGVDLVVGEQEQYPVSAVPPDGEASEVGRRPFDPPLWVARLYETSLNELSLSVDGARWSVQERHRRLDDSIPSAAGFEEFNPEEFGITLSTSPPLIPAARKLYGVDLSTSAHIGARRFWTMAAGLLADQTHAEAALLRVWDLGVELDDDVPESVAAVWLRHEDPALIYYLKGSQLKPLLDQAAAQRDNEAAGLPIGDQIRFTAAGLDKKGKLHDEPIDDQQYYKVAVSQVLAEALGLSNDAQPILVGKTVDELVLDDLRRRRDSPPADYRHWMEGQPVSREGFWKINFRDVGVTVNDSQVVRSDDFDNVPNSRIQGFDQFTLGGDFKADAAYLSGPYRWTNTLEMEYSRTSVAPRGQPSVTNTTANRIYALTMDTRRAGAIDDKWLAQSWGPSLGFEYDGQFQADPGLPRKNIYSVLPGVQLYDGTFIRTLELSANIKRDDSRIPPNTQEGLHFRTLFSKSIGETEVTGAPINVQGEFYANYFFLTQTDTDQDLRFESDFNLKLDVPIRRYLTISPFIDYYVFEWKLAPIFGYSAMTGVQIGFTRLWKPQYEPLLGL